MAEVTPLMVVALASSKNTSCVNKVHSSFNRPVEAPMGDEDCTNAYLLRGRACHFRLPSLNPALDWRVT